MVPNRKKNTDKTATFPQVRESVKREGEQTSEHSGARAQSKQGRFSK